MSDSDGNNRNRNDGWHDNESYNSQHEYQSITAAGANLYMVPNCPEPFVTNPHLQNSIHQNHQLHHLPPHAAHSQNQVMQHQQIQHQYPPQFVQHPDYAGSSRNDGFTVMRTANGGYIKVYYNNDDAMKYNNYELFSNNSYIPHHMAKQPQQSNQEHYFGHAAPSNGHTDERAATENNTNFINQLVENWVPNMSGTYTPFGESPLPPQQISSPVAPQQAHNSTSSINQTDHIAESIEKSLNSATFVDHSSHLDESQVKTATIDHATMSAQPTRTNGSFQHESTIKGNNDVKKPRMIAEVKPMRMSYSDVLSKNVFINKKNSSESSGNGNNTSGTGQSLNGSSIHNSQLKSSKSEKNKNVFSSNEKKPVNTYEDKDASVGYRPSKTAMSNNSPQNNSTTKNVGTGENDPNKDNKSAEMDSKQAKKKNGTTTAGGKNLNRAKNLQSEMLNKRRSQSDISSSHTATKDESDKNLQNSGFFYNITKNESSQSERSISGIAGKPSQHKKSASVKLSTSSSFNRSGSSKADKSNQYQQKRIQKTRRNTTYAMLAKLFETWLEYLIRFLKWLIALVCDVVVLSFGIILDRLTACFDYSRQQFSSLRNELTSNSGRRPSTYFINLWLKFDKRFGKDSKFAFWRGFNKKKPPEPVPDYYKNGRLPQTGDEAMYSLLNCKGKDAYSILGVQADCTQEQIRKHYKKIAVLVHPDKNKQAGAEEAFKILQRAFELIGEPETRKSYDQSVAEALNAEKAWSELNDLLRQLQTKIAEAANTIRCSSCGLRHPRKPTGRPHFAARQCNTCKIRHTAREGDIWAETSLFGLRWKYLALMEGKVLDITEWANCQKGALSHLQPNSHIVQYRIVLGGQQQQQNQQQHQQHQQQPDKERIKRDQATEPSLDEFLDNLYSGQNPQNTSGSGSRRRNRKN